MRLTENTGHIK